MCIRDRLPEVRRSDRLAVRGADHSHRADPAGVRHVHRPPHRPALSLIHIFFIEHGDVLIAHVRQIVGAGQAGRAGADDGDLLRVRIGDAAVGDDLRDVALVGLQLLLGDKLLDLVDGDGAVDVAAGAGVLAAAVADAAADGRERVILLDELERCLLYTSRCV